ncbi:MAG TPA: DNA-processing protein DprA, partial [Acidimicrobiales bacterium]|nr:DNA-processing protein DprA [Acidimicrobiales bacterium]
VVGSGLDHVYPHRNHDLWQRVAAEGALVSESPLGRPPERWRFPARNRIIAALSRAVVVVESRDRGGSMLTAGEALDRGVPVLAVPGPVLTEHSAGTNRLITEGATLVRDVTDVLVAVGAGAPLGSGRSGVRAGSGVDEPADPATAAVAAVLSPAPVSAERVADAAGVGVVEALTALARLEAAGRARRVPGGYEAVVS